MSEPFTPIEKASLSWKNGLPFSNRFADIYFSQKNGLKEAQYVFVEGNRLLERWKKITDHFVIGELGFGSGLNFLLTWSLWLKHAPATAALHFISCEQFPFSKEDLLKSIQLWPDLQLQAQQLYEQYPVLTPGFHCLEFEQGRIRLTLMLGDALSCYRQLLHCGDAALEKQLRNHFVDAWFLDGFSPPKNESMWSTTLCHLLALLSKPGSTLATFSAAAVVKNNLQTAGFQVKKVKGFGYKRDMIVGHFIEHLNCPKTLRFTPWHYTKSKNETNKKAIVLGAGLAGCYSAYALAKRGWQVTLIDEQNEVGLGASGNPHAVLYPKLSAYHSPLTSFLLSSFLFAKRLYQPWIQENAIGDLSGILQLAYHPKEARAQAELGSLLNAYPELGRLVDAKEASLLAGIELHKGGLFIPGAGWLNLQALCRVLKKKPGIDWVANTRVEELHFANNQWHVGTHRAEVLIIANGHRATQFSQTADLPLKAIRGQMTYIPSNNHSDALAIPLCGDGHIVPAQQGIHAIGASFQIGATHLAVDAKDDRSNLAKLKNIPTSILWSEEIQESWAGIRTATTDYLPLVGPVVDRELFLQQFASLESNSKRWLPIVPGYLPGLYVCAGFGSRGLATIPLCGEYLASLINNEWSYLPLSLGKALSPARFLFKKIIKKK